MAAVANAAASQIVFITDGFLEGSISGTFGAGTGAITYLGKPGVKGAATWRVDGDLNIDSGVLVTSSGGRVQLIVGDDVNAAGVKFDFTGLGGPGGPGGAGGAAGAPGLQFFPSPGGAGGAGGTCDLDGVCDQNGFKGDNGPAGVWGGDGGGGLAGASGLGGGSGEGAAASNGGAGAAGGSGGAGGLGGFGGKAVSGGPGGTPPPGGTLPVSGDDGHWGGLGTAGSSGTSGDAGNGGLHPDDVLSLAEGGGGGGGGGPGGGGAGGNGGNGSGGGGGGGAAALLLDDAVGNAGGAGGIGGVGGIGGAGASGTQVHGGEGGAGGGAFSIHANGRVVLGGAIATGDSGNQGETNFDDAQSGSPGSAGGSGLAGDASLPGHVGASGGAGGNGGAGGDGGAAGLFGGAGGGGAGGTVHVVGTIAHADEIDVSGGPGSSAGEHGRVMFGQNVAVMDTPIAGDGAPLITIGSRDLNPFVFAPANGMTPFIPDLPQIGAEIYGVTNIDPADVAIELGGAFPDKDVNGTLLASSIAALVRLPFSGSEYVAGFIDDFTGFDMLLYVNLLSTPLDQIAMTWDSSLVPLLTRGWFENPLFGGNGPDQIPVLAGHGVYATLVPQEGSVGPSQLAANGAISLKGTLDAGDVLYVGSAFVPEPASASLLVAGLMWMQLRARVLQSERKSRDMH